MNKEITVSKDYRCTKCKFLSDNNTLVEQSEPELVGLDSEPYYRWTEIHKCQNCKALYQFENNS